MDYSKTEWKAAGIGSRRSGADRRYFSYSSHIPERRAGQDRRGREDRRSGSDRRLAESQQIGFSYGKREDAPAGSCWN